MAPTVAHFVSLPAPRGDRCACGLAKLVPQPLRGEVERCVWLVITSTCQRCFHSSRHLPHVSLACELGLDGTHDLAHVARTYLGA